MAVRYSQNSPSQIQLIFSRSHVRITHIYIQHPTHVYAIQTQRLQRSTHFRTRMHEFRKIRPDIAPFEVRDAATARTIDARQQHPHQKPGTFTKSHPITGLLKCEIGVVHRANICHHVFYFCTPIWLLRCTYDDKISSRFLRGIA